jgi:O-antigen/teichoic acid export membrane protein
MTYAAARVALGALTGTMITRMLGPEGRGTYMLVVTVATIAGCVGHLSIEYSHVSLWARASNRAAIAANSLLLGPVMGGLCALGTAVVVMVLGSDVLPVPGFGPFAVALLAIPCSLAVVYLNNVLVLRSRIEWVNWGGLLAAAVQCAALVLLIALGRVSVAWAVALWTVCAAVPLAVLIPAVRPRLRDRDVRLARRAVGIGLRYHIGLVSLFLLFRVDILLLGGMTSAAAVGLYSLAVSVAELARVAAESVAQVAMPEQLGGEPAAAVDFTVRITRLAVPLSCGSIGLLCAAAPFAVPLAYGAVFTGAVGPLLALAPGLWALCTTRTINTFLLRLDRPLLMSAMSITALLVNVGLNVALIPAFGIVGCALASSVAYGVLAGMQVTWFLAATGTPLRRLLPRPADVRHVRETSLRFIASGSRRPESSARRRTRCSPGRRRRS